MEPSGRLHHASSETTLIIARRSRFELIAPFIPFSKARCVPALASPFSPDERLIVGVEGCVLATYPFTEVERAPECDSFIEKRVKSGIPFGDTMKASVKPRSPALNAIGTAQVHGYRKSLFWWNVWSGSRKAVRHSHTCQRNLRVFLGTKHERG